MPQILPTIVACWLKAWACQIWESFRRRRDSCLGSCCTADGGQVSLLLRGNNVNKFSLLRVYIYVIYV